MAHSRLADEKALQRSVNCPREHCEDETLEWAPHSGPTAVRDSSAVRVVWSWDR